MRPGVSSNPPLHGRIVCTPAPGTRWGSTGRIDATSKVSRSITFATGGVCVVWAETAIEPARLTILNSCVTRFLMISSSAHEAINPGLKLFRPYPEGRLLYSRIGGTRHRPHLAVVGAVGAEKAVAHIHVEDGFVVRELGVHQGVRLRDLPPRLSPQLAARKCGGEQNLRLRLSRTDLRDDARVACDKFALAVADRLITC